MNAYIYSYSTPAGTSGEVIATNPASARAKARHRETGGNPFQGYMTSEIRIKLLAEYDWRNPGE